MSTENFILEIPSSTGSCGDCALLLYYKICLLNIIRLLKNHLKTLF